REHMDELRPYIRTVKPCRVRGMLRTRRRRPCSPSGRCATSTWLARSLALPLTQGTIAAFCLDAPTWPGVRSSPPASLSMRWLLVAGGGHRGGRAVGGKGLSLPRFQLAGPPTPRDTEASNAYAVIGFAPKIGS